MEIADGFRLTPWRIAVTGLLAAVAAVAAGSVVRNKPTEYQATVKVFVGQVLGRDETSFSLGPLLSDFETTALFPDIIKSVAAAADVPVASVAQQLKAKRDGEGTSVSIIYIDNEAKRATKVAQEAARFTLIRLAQREVDGAQGRLGRLQKSLHSTDEALLRLSAATGINDLDTYFEKLDESTLATQAELVVTADPDTKVVLEQRLKASSEEIQRLASARLQHNELRDQRQITQGIVSQTAGDLETATNRVAAAKDGNAITIAGLTAVSKLVPEVRAGMAAFAFVAVLLGALFFLADTRRRSIRAGAAVQADHRAVPDTP